VTGFAALRAAPSFGFLRAASARLGADPLQVQAGGGNTSLKGGGAMWIKASGAWLADAGTRDMFVPVELDALRAAIAAGDPRAEGATAFVPADENPSGLRPSIETAVHAVLDAPVVLHTHCVATIAVAIREDGEAVLARRLGATGAVWIPYVKPGLRLAQEIAARAGPSARVLALGNHGLVAAGETVAEAEALLRDVSERLAPAALPADPAPDLPAALCGEGWVPAEHGSIHALALDPARLRLATGGPWFPDGVVFLGPAVAAARPGETAAEAAARVAADGAPAPALALVPGRGAALRADASPAVKALARCLGDVLARVEPRAPLRPLPPEAVAALLDWDAEKHRQAMAKARA
jgi:rhamnose utilization protein RhaD (predicted bifunctional aldolase and dehydrogenase)